MEKSQTPASLSKPSQSYAQEANDIFTNSRADIISNNHKIKLNKSKSVKINRK